MLTDRALYERTPAMLQAIDLEGSIIAVSDRWLAVMDYPRNEVIGRPWQSFLISDSQTAIKTDDRSLQWPAINWPDQQLKLLKRNGELLNASISVDVVQANGIPVSCVAIFTQITDAQRQLEALPDRLVRMNRDGLCLSSNAPLAYPVAGDATDFVGCNIRDLMPADIVAERLEVIGQVLDRQKVQSTEYQIVVQGQQRWEEARIIPLTQNEVLILTRDIDERKQAEAEVHRLNQALAHQKQHLEAVIAERTAALMTQATQLAAMNQELQSFSYSVSHDLRAPLRYINGFIGALKRHLGPKVQTDATVDHYLKVIGSSSHTMGLLIDGLLTLSRVGRVELNRCPLSLLPLIENSFNLLGIALDQSDQLQVTIDDLAWVQGDATLLQQVLINLIDNAVKFSCDRAPARIHISQSPEGVFCIRDNGVGFDMTYAGKLFAPFQRLHRQEQFAGTGIGLAIVHRIIRRHDGDIWVDSTPGKGTTFYFTLPPG